MVSTRGGARLRATASVEKAVAKAAGLSSRLRLPRYKKKITSLLVPLPILLVEEEIVIGNRS